MSKSRANKQNRLRAQIKRQKMMFISLRGGNDYAKDYHINNRKENQC